MRKFFFIILTFIFLEVCSICFVKEDSIKRFNQIGNIKGADEYHCKIACTEREECQSFGFLSNICMMYGASRFSWVDAREEWFKKTSVADCQGQIKQPSITEQYYPSTSINYLTDIGEFEMEFNTWQACPKGWMLDVLLPNNSRRIEGDVFNHIHWNGSIGAWILTKKTVQSKVNFTMYIRAARCFLIEPELHTDTTSCGERLPMPTGQVLDKPVKLNGVHFEDCGSFQFITDFDSRRNVTYVYDNALVCVDGSWMFLERSGSTIIAAWKILKGICF